MKKQLSSSKKILLAATLVGVFVILAVVSLVVVLAAANQNVNSNISVTYVVDGVSAKVGAKYSIVPRSSTAEISKVSMTNGNAEEVVFGVEEDETTKSLVPQSDIVLTSTAPKVVFEYSFTNLANSAFTVGLADLKTTATITNMKVGYYVSHRALRVSELRNSFIKDTLEVQAMTENNKEMYVYICLEIEDLTQKASFSGEILWSLTFSESVVNINLNNNGGNGTSSLKAIANANMPFVYEKPTQSGKTFGGYYLGSTKYIDENGHGVKLCDLTNGETLTAQWTNSQVVVENGTLLSLSDVGKSAETVTIPSNVQTIGESAFENNTVVKTIDYSEALALAASDEETALKRIEANAFKNCSNLTTLRLPNSIKTIEGSVLSGCTNLQTLEFPYLLGDVIYTSNGLSTFFGSVNADVPASLINIHVNGGNIGEYGFWGSKIQTVTLSGVNEIGHGAFEKCTALANIDLGDDLQIIGNSSISNTAISSIYIPKTVSKVYNVSFSGCSNLTSIIVDEANAYYTDGNNDCIIEIATKTYLSSCNASASVVVPEGVEIIETRAFSGFKNITSITFPSTLKVIGRKAFADGCGVTSIIVPASVNCIIAQAFNGSKVTSVTFENTNGWFLAQDEFATSGSGIDVTTPATNATNLKGSWVSFYVKRK